MSRADFIHTCFNRENSRKSINNKYKVIDLFYVISGKIHRDYANMYSKELIEILFSNVYTKISFLVDSGIASRNSASKYLNMLVPSILEKKKIGKENIYVNKKLYELLKDN